MSMPELDPTRKSEGQDSPRPSSGLREILLDPIRMRRVQANHESQMHADATTICLGSRQLKKLVDIFVSEYSPEESYNLFTKADCHIPSDLSGKKWDPSLLWSEWVYEDVTGFQWALKSFLSAIESIICMPNPEDVNNIETEAPADEDDATPVLVGEGSVS